MRVVIAEDTVLLREGLAGLLKDAGYVAIIDVRMPPTHEDEGMHAAAVIREDYPATAVLVLSQHIGTKHSLGLLASGTPFHLTRRSGNGL